MREIIGLLLFAVCGSIEHPIAWSLAVLGLIIAAPWQSGEDESGETENAESE